MVNKKKVNNFINRYPLDLFHMSERVIGEGNLNVNVKEFHYKTPTINFNSYLNNKEDIRYYLSEYMLNTGKHVDEYISTNCLYNILFGNCDIVLIYEIYIQRFYEGIVEQSKKVLSFQDGDGRPTYFLKDITPDFFHTPYKIHVKVDVQIIEPREEPREEPEEEQRDIPTFKILKMDDCVICLNNKPEIMFYDCLHCCVCSDCEKVKPLMKCPYCRKEIIAKIII